MKRPHAPRALTLIELMVSLALLAGVLAVCVGLLVGAIRNGARARAHAQLSRQGQYLDSLLGGELRMAGLGVPAGRHITDAYAGAGATSFDTDVILATATAVGVVGDFPRADAQYSAFGMLANRPSGSRSNVMWHTENNGACAPNTIGATCNTSTTSMFFPGETGCASVAGVTDRTCPWGMRRVVAGERLQIVSGLGTWTHAGTTTPLAMTSSGALGVLSLNLATTWDAAWPNLAANDPPVAVSGQGYVTSIDRVFYRYVAAARTVERIQCSGDPDPQNVSWPNLATNTLPAVASLALTPLGGGAANTCVGPEVVAKDVASLTFTYYAADGTVTAAKDQIRRIDWTIQLEKVVNTRTVDQDVVGTAAIRAFQ